VKAVRRLSGRSVRLKEGRFVAEGPQSVREAVDAHARALAAPGSADPNAARSRAGGRPVVQELYASHDAQQRYPDIVETARAAGLAIRPATDEVLAVLADTVTPQGLVAVCSLVDVPLAQALEHQPRLVTLLASVRDPGNAGTVLRAADAAGAEAVVLTRESVDVHNPKCVRATAGSLFHLPVVTGVELAPTLDTLRAAGLVVLAADGAGDVDLDDLLDDAAAGSPGGLAGPVAWLFGNEAWGLSDDDRALADAVVRVPVHGRAESLNLATAATVCLYASARAQRRGPGCRVE
jgi:TrmH family RNA methyltransferase